MFAWSHDGALGAGHPANDVADPCTHRTSPRRLDLDAAGQCIWCDELLLPGLPPAEQLEGLDLECGSDSLKRADRQVHLRGLDPLPVVGRHFRARGSLGLSHLPSEPELANPVGDARGEGVGVGHGMDVTAPGEKRLPSSVVDREWCHVKHISWAQREVLGLLRLAPGTLLPRHRRTLRALYHRGLVELDGPEWPHVYRLTARGKATALALGCVMPRWQRHPDRVRCGCGAWLNWYALPLLGVQDDDVERVELRNCPACGSTRGRVVEALR